MQNASVEDIRKIYLLQLIAAVKLPNPKQATAEQDSNSSIHRCAASSQIYHGWSCYVEPPNSSLH